MQIYNWSYICVAIALFIQTLIIITVFAVVYDSKYNNIINNDLILDNECEYGCPECRITNTYITKIYDTNVTYITYDVDVIINGTLTYPGTACVTNIFFLEDDRILYERIDTLHGMAVWLCTSCSDITCSNIQYGKRCFVTSTTHEYNTKQYHDVFLDVLPMNGVYDSINFNYIIFVCTIFFISIISLFLIIRYMHYYPIYYVVFQNYDNTQSINISIVYYVVSNVFGVIFIIISILLLQQDFSFDGFTSKNNVVLLIVLYLLIPVIYAQLIFISCILFSSNEHMLPSLPIIGIYYFYNLNVSKRMNALYIYSSITNLFSIMSYVPSAILATIYFYKKEETSVIWIFLVTHGFIGLMCTCAFGELHYRRLVM